MRRLHQARWASLPRGWRQAWRSPVPKVAKWHAFPLRGKADSVSLVLRSALDRRRLGLGGDRNGSVC